MQPPKTKTARHHWWPEGVSDFWKGDDGRCEQLMITDGKLKAVRSYPRQFGAIGNGHCIKFGGPWDTSFESEFDSADSNFPTIINSISSLERRENHNNKLQDRLHAQHIDSSFREKLMTCMSSLIARSPRTRNKISLRTERDRNKFGLSSNKKDLELLVAANLRGLHPRLSKLMLHGGKIAALYSDNHEFIFGDGFFNTLPISRVTNGEAMCLLPLTPWVTILFFRQSAYFRNPELVTIVLNETEVAFINEITQACSCKFIYYRHQRPEITKAFMSERYFDIEDYEATWLGSLVTSVQSLR